MRRFLKLFSWIFVLINFIKRCICRRKKLKNDDAKLPNTVLDQQSSQKPEGGDLASWDDWDQNDSGLISVKVEPCSPVEEASSEQNEVDIFGDMQPVFQKTKKILVKSRAPEINNSYQTSDRLKFNSTIAVPETELGTWTEDSNAWNEISEQEIEYETQNVLREKRLAEREKRALEQLKKKEERETTRAAKKTAGNLGIKIS